MGKTISDTILTIHAHGKRYKFHLEAEISTKDTNDTTIVLRMFDYEYQDALRHKEIDGDKITLNFSEGIIILLEHNSKSPDKVTLELNFGKQGKIDFTIPTMKFLDHSLNDLEKRKMVILLPLYLLKLRKQVEIAKKDRNILRQNADELKALINTILDAFDENEKAGNISNDDAFVLAGLVETLYDHMYGNIPEFKEEGVKDMLAGRLLVRNEEEILKERQRAQEEKLEITNRLLVRNEEEKLEIAKNFLAKGVSPEDVADATKLPITKVRKLHVQIKPAG